MENTNTGSEQKRARVEGTTTTSTTARIEWAINALRERLECHNGAGKESTRHATGGGSKSMSLRKRSTMNLKRNLQ